MKYSRLGLVIHLYEVQFAKRVFARLENFIHIGIIFNLEFEENG